LEVGVVFVALEGEVGFAVAVEVSGDDLLRVGIEVEGARGLLFVEVVSGEVAAALYQVGTLIAGASFSPP